MEQLGKLLVVLSSLAGAYLASLHATEINWPVFLPVMLFGGIGAMLVSWTYLPTTCASKSTACFAETWHDSPMFGTA